MTMGIRKIVSIGIVAVGVLALPAVAIAGERGEGHHVESRGAGGMDPSVAAFRQRVRDREAAGRAHVSGGEAQEHRATEHRSSEHRANERRSSERRVEPMRTGRARPRDGALHREARLGHPARGEAIRPVVRTRYDVARARDVRPAAPVADAPRRAARPAIRAADGYGAPPVGYGPRFGYGPRIVRVVPRFAYRVRVIRLGYGFRRFGFRPRFGFGFRRFGYGPRFAFR